MAISEESILQYQGKGIPVSIFVDRFEQGFSKDIHMYIVLHCTTYAYKYAYTRMYCIYTHKYIWLSLLLLNDWVTSNECNLII